MYHIAVINENAVITVTTHNSATQILEYFRENKMVLPPSRFGIIDCITKSIGETAFETENIKIASSPMDLTGIGVRISQLAQ